jgi:hypothetical protein
MNNRTLWAILSLGLACWLAIALWPAPEPARYAAEGLEFSASVGEVRMLWDCAEVRWQVAEADALRLNGEPVDLRGESRACPTQFYGTQFNPSRYAAVWEVERAGQVQRVELVEIRFIRPILWLLTLAGLGLVGLALWGWRGVWWRWLMDSQALSPERGVRLAAWGASAWAVLAALGALSAAPQEGAALLLAGLASLSAVGFSLPQAGRLWASMLGARWGAFVWLAWYLLTVPLIDRLALAGLTWTASALQSWQAGLTLWLMAVWVASYLGRTLNWTPERRRHWLSVMAVGVLAGLVFGQWTFSFIRPIRPETITVVPPNPTYLTYRTVDQNPDGANYYMPQAQDFPYGLREDSYVLHRVLIYLWVSQACQILDIPYVGYADGALGCSSIDQTLFGYWTVYFNLYLAVCLIVYELVRRFFPGRVALWAAILTALSPLNVWFVSIPSTDYADLVVTMTSLWLIYRLCSAPERVHPWPRLVAYGLLFGLMLVMKLFAIYFIFGGMMALAFRRTWAFGVAALVAAGVWFGYQVLIESFGVPYTVVESQGWESFVWIRTTFRSMIPYEQAATLVRAFGHTASQAALLFGLLFLMAVWVMSLNEKYPRLLMGLAWAVILAGTLWRWGFLYTYTTHAAGLIPFFYSAVGLGLWQFQDWLLARYGRLGRVLGWGVGLAIIGHMLFQWVAWDTRHFIYCFLWDCAARY